jgi:hypothetical protein
MDSKIINPSDGRSGGLIMLWKREISIQQVFSSPKYIDVHIDEGQGRKWRPTGIYGEPRWEDKYKTWDKMRELKHDSNLPWLILGDFNEIMFSHEKEGGNQRPAAFMQAFRDALTDCDLEDLGFQGEKFTWKRGRIRERLDRAVSDGAWNTMHPGAVVLHLDYTKSDHRPILVDTDYQPAVTGSRTGPRRFEAKWLREAGFRDVVKAAWESAGEATSRGVLAKLGRMHKSIHEWDSSVLKKPHKRLRRAQRKLENAMNGQMNDENEERWRI